MNTQNAGLEKVTPFKHGNFIRIHVRFLGCNPVHRSEGSGVFHTTFHSTKSKCPKYIYAIKTAMASFDSTIHATQLSTNNLAKL